MTNFIFNTALSEISSGAIAFPGDNFYAVLTNGVPLISSNTRAALSEVGSPSAELTGKNYTSGVFSSDPALFTNQTFSAATGVVLVKRLGSTPSTSDRVISYSHLFNSSSAPLSLNLSSELMAVYPNASTGWVNVINVFVYNSAGRGGLAMNVSTDGVYYLLGTRNNTVAFDSNNTNPRFQYYRWTNGGGDDFNNALRPTQRIGGGNQSFSPTVRYVIRTPGRRIRANTMALQVSAATTITIRGSNADAYSTSANCWNNLLSDVIYTGAVTTSLTDIVIASSVYYETFIFSAAAGTIFQQIDFYNSQIFSQTLNLV